MADTIFWSNTNKLLKRNKTTQEIMCAEINISINTLRGWVSKNVLPRADEAVKIAIFLKTSVEYLVTGDDLKLPSVTLPTFNSLNSYHQQMIVEMITMMHNEEQHEIEKSESYSKFSNAG